MSETAQQQQITTLPDAGAALGCPPGIRTMQYLKLRVEQALKAESAIEALSMIADGETSDPVAFAAQALISLQHSPIKEE